MATDETKCRNQLGYLVDQVSAFSISNIQICWYLNDRLNFIFFFSELIDYFINF